MSNQVQTIFVGPQVEGRDIKVLNHFTFCCTMIQFDGIRASPEKDISRLKPGHEFKGVDQGTNGVIVLSSIVPIRIAT